MVQPLLRSWPVKTSGGVHRDHCTAGRFRNQLNKAGESDAYDA